MTHRVTWFNPPNRPVEGNTIYVRPTGEAGVEAAPEDAVCDELEES